MASPAVECVVDVKELDNGQMKVVELGESKVLLLNDNGKYCAVSTKCTHYGAPLASGVFANGHIRCPWHGACFNVRTGDIEDFPGLDSLQTFKVKEEKGKVTISSTEDELKTTKFVKPCAKAVHGASESVLIVGGGPAAAVCAETLRQEGFGGKIIIATKEKYLPYDRPKLSKACNMSADQIALRNADFYKERQIEFKFEKEAVKVDVGAKKVSFRDGEALSYSKLVLATGAYPRVLTMIPGYQLKNILTLRSLDDSQLISQNAEGKNVVIIGTSFIGVEMAAALVGKAKQVTIVDLVEAPFQLALGKEVGTAVKKILDDKGVVFHFKTSAKEFHGNSDGKVVEVTLTDGQKIPADLCVLGVGVAPATEFLTDSGLKISDRGFVVVNKEMQTNDANVYAAGDITHFPLFMVNDEHVNVQHWQMAKQQGRIAALSIVGKPLSIKSVPFFWTVLCGKSVRYTGYGVGYDDILIQGSLAELKFVAYYFKSDKLIAVASLQSDPIAAQAAEVFFSGISLSRKDIEQDPKEWVKKLQIK